MSKKIFIAKILKSHGIKGNVKLESYMDNPKDIFNYSNDLYDKNNEQFKIKYIGVYKDNIFLVRINDINNPEEVSLYTNTKLYIDISLLKKLSNEQFYYEELLNLNVISSDKKYNGKIISINDFGAGTVIEIKWENEKMTETLPFVKDYFKKIDIKNNLVIIERPKYI